MSYSVLVYVSQKVLDGVMDPLHFGQVWIYDCNKTKPLWEVTILLLKDKKLYLSSNVSVQHFSDLPKIVCTLSYDLSLILYVIFQHQNVLKFIKKPQNGCFRHNKSVRYYINFCDDIDNY